MADMQPSGPAGVALEKMLAHPKSPPTFDSLNDAIEFTRGSVAYPDVTRSGARQAMALCLKKVKKEDDPDKELYAWKADLNLKAFYQEAY